MRHAHERWGDKPSCSGPTSKIAIGCVLAVGRRQPACLPPCLPAYLPASLWVRVAEQAAFTIAGCKPLQTLLTVGLDQINHQQIWIKSLSKLPCTPTI
jgi:hypothetical protein